MKVVASCSLVAFIVLVTTYTANAQCEKPGISSCSSLILPPACENAPCTPTLIGYNSITGEPQYEFRCNNATGLYKTNNLYIGTESTAAGEIGSGAYARGADVNCADSYSCKGCSPLNLYNQSYCKRDPVWGPIQGHGVTLWNAVGYGPLCIGDGDGG